jgi:hypothetical protein
MLILVTSGFLELLVNAVIDEKCKNAKKINENNRDYPFSVKLVLLNEMGLMSDGSFGNINWLRKVRNRAAHDAFFRVSSQELSQLKAEYRDPSKLHTLCLMIWGSFWNEHVDLFVKKFMPSAFGTEATQEKPESDWEPSQARSPT